MNEVILETFDHDIVAFDGQTLSFANGEDPSLFGILFWVVGFFVLILVGNFFQSVLEKYNIFSGKIQMYAPYLLIFVLLLGSFMFMQKKFIEPPVHVPIEERRNLVTIELPTQKVTIKEKNTVTETFTFSKDDYFYLSTLHANKSTSYSLLLMHNGKQKEVLYSNHFNEITKVQTFLIEHGFTVKVLP